MKPLRSLLPTPIFWITFFIALSYTSYAQVENDTLLASQYYKKADSLLTDRKYDTSVEYFKKALPLYKKAKAWQRVASCYNKISQNQWRNRKLEESLLNANKVLQTSIITLDENNRERAIAFDNIGIYYLKKHEYANAITHLKKALEIKEKISLNGNLDIAVSYSYLGVTNRRMKKYERALHYHKKALSIIIRILGSENEKAESEYSNIGTLYGELREYHNAIESYKKSIVSSEKRLGKNNYNSAYAHFFIASSYHSLNQHEKALTYYKKIVAFFKKEEDLHPLLATYNNIGMVLTNMGRFNSALEYNKKTLGISRRIYGNEDHPEIATVYWNIGFALEGKKDYKNSLQNYNKALETFKKDNEGNNEDVATLYNNIGNVYLNKKDFVQGLKYYQKALQIAQNIFEKNNPEIARVNISIGNLYLEKKVYDKALVYYLKSLDILQNSEKQNLLHLQVLNQIGKAYYNKKDFQKAISYYSKAIIANSRGDNPKIDYVNTNPLGYYNLNILLKILGNKAKALQGLYLESNKKSNLNQSITIYKRADSLINHVRQSFQNYQDKIMFAKQAKETYKDAVRAQLLLHKNKRNKEVLEEAFYYAEKSKSNTLKEFLNSSSAKRFSKLPKDILNLEKDIKTDKAFYVSQILTEQSKQTEIDTSRVTHFENKLFDINRRKDSLTQILEKNYPKYYQLKYQNNIVSVQEIQQQLDDNTTVLEFFTGDSITYAFTISKKNIAVQELDTPKLTEQVEEFRKTIADKNTTDFKQQSHRLYNQLIAPIANKLIGDNLIIIPDGSLWHLNFELLLTQNDNSNNPALLSYLLREYAVTYANSANLLFGNSIPEQQDKPLQECLAFSFSDSTQTGETRAMSLAALRDAGDDLPGTRKEIRAISDIIDGQYFYGSQAIEANFKKNAGQYNILHLALHGEVDNERPENSKLYFTKSKDTLEDNLLYSHELFALDIPAELTVLSACNTGTGKIAKGEGVMSLGTAFQYAGTKSLLLTSWEVSDQTTPELMKYFYTNLKDGMSKAKALQQAKLQYLTTADINRLDPFYWGAFYLVGDAAPIPFESNTLLYWILGVLVLLVLGGLFWYRRRVRGRVSEV